MPIVHVTPGLLDVRGFTILGLHAKPNTDTPIGKFGSGLKYAVATLVRLGCKVQVFIGDTEYEFYTKNADFRGVGYKQLMMKKKKGFLSKWTYIELPFTTEFGRFWKAWQAFRELESNTRDECGYTGADPSIVDPRDYGQTVIIVSGEPYEEAYRDRDKVFLPEALTKREGDDRVQVFNEPSKFLYWRGIRVADLDKPSIYTYNILADLELTEDRTIKYMFYAHSHIASYIARSKDQKLINAVVSAKGEVFEAKLDFDYAHEAPSPEFLEVIRKKRLRGGYVGTSATGYYTKYEPTPRPEVKNIKTQISEFAYDTDLPEALQELLKKLLRCEITEPASYDDDSIPF